VKERMPQAKCIIPEGSYVIWLDLRGYGLTDEQIKHKIINEAHLVLQGGSNFDSTYGQQFQRICIPSPRSMIQEAFERLEKVFA
jgi:cystathionine beta-lyase